MGLAFSAAAFRRASASANARCAAGVSSLRGGLVSFGLGSPAITDSSYFRSTRSRHCAAAAKCQSDSYIWHIRMAVMLSLSVACRTLAELPPSPSNVQSMPAQRFARPSEVPGLAARRIAADVLDGVLHKHRTLDEQLDGAAAHPGLKTLADRDRALMRRLVATILRRLGTLGHLLSKLLDRGIPTDAPRAQSALL